MMQINRNNYGAFFLDYAEKNLSEEDRHDLARFLEENPDLQDEFFAFEPVSLKPDYKIVFEQKSKLRKPVITPVGSIHQENYEEWIIAALEGDLSAEEMIDFEEFKAINPIIEFEISAYKRTFIKPKSGIIFPDKSLLKRHLAIPFKKKMILFTVSSAAVLLIAFGVFRLLTVQPTSIFRQQAKTYENPGKTINTPESKQPDPEFKTIDNQTTKKEQIISDITQSRLVAGNQAKDYNNEISEKYTREIDFIHPLLLHDKKALQISLNQGFEGIFPTRDEMSSIFEYMILRDVIDEKMITQENKKSAMARVFDNIAYKIINKGSQPSEEPALINNLASRSKQAFLEFADGLPIYRSIKKDDNDRILFAIGDNMSIGLSRNNPHQDNFPTNPE